MRRNFSVQCWRFSIAAIFVSLVLPICSHAQKTSGREVIFPITVQWTRQKAVTKYRLQIAADEEFENIYLDKRVFGSSYTVKDLSSGYYYWRVVPADAPGGNFSRPIRFFISGGVVTPVILPNRSSVATRAGRPRSH